MTAIRANRLVVWHSHGITRDHRESFKSTAAIIKTHRSKVIWFTGLSGSGKSTLANAVEKCLHESGIRTFILDGDNIRHGLCQDLAFSSHDRIENIRRVAEVAKLFLEAGVVTLTAFISPLRSDRDSVREMLNKDDFIEIFCDCPISVCEERDVKGMYKMARAGLIENFTGISSIYEVPKKPDLKLNTSKNSIEECVCAVINLLNKKNILLNINH